MAPKLKLSKFKGGRGCSHAQDFVKKQKDKGKDLDYIKKSLFRRGLCKGRVSQLLKPIRDAPAAQRPRSIANVQVHRKRSSATQSSSPAQTHSASSAQVLPSDVRPSTVSQKTACPPEHIDYLKTPGMTMSKSAGKFKAYIQFQGFSIDTFLLEDVECVWQNRKAMKRVHHRVCQWLAEERLEDEQVTDAEFVAFLRGVVEEVRASWPDMVAWRYHSEIKLPNEEHAHRVITTGNLAEALRGWRQLRLKLDVSGVFNVAECVQHLRQSAEQTAQRIMAGLAADGFPTDSHALEVLREWGFKQNKSRVNVLPEGREWVFSDTLGLVIPRTVGHTSIVSEATHTHETVFHLLHRWICGRLPEPFRSEGVAFTSMSLNKGYSAKLHRDSRNEGPSVAIAAGDFTGGRLKYFPSDDGHMDFEILKLEPHVLLDTRAPQIFNGKFGHEVEPFTGERFSVILFTCPRRKLASEETCEYLHRLGISMPTDANLRMLQSHSAGATDISPGVAAKRMRKRINLQKNKKWVASAPKAVGTSTSSSSGRRSRPKAAKDRGMHVPNSGAWAKAAAAAKEKFPEDRYEASKLAKRLYTQVLRGESVKSEE